MEVFLNAPLLLLVVGVFVVVVVLGVFLVTLLDVFPAGCLEVEEEDAGLRFSTSLKTELMRVDSTSGTGSKFDSQIDGSSDFLRRLLLARTFSSSPSDSEESLKLKFSGFLVLAFTFLGIPICGKGWKT